MVSKHEISFTAKFRELQINSTGSVIRNLTLDQGVTRCGGPWIDTLVNDVLAVDVGPSLFLTRRDHRWSLKKVSSNARMRDVRLSIDACNSAVVLVVVCFESTSSLRS
jgi:hypothetical protein